MEPETDNLVGSDGFAEALIELIRRTACDLPEDVTAALKKARSEEEPGSTAEITLSSFLENIELAREEMKPLCQDTGLPIFFVRHPQDLFTLGISRALREALAEATELGYLRSNAVDPVTGENSGTNEGKGFPSMHFTETDDESVEISLILKGGGSENVSRQYSLPMEEPEAERDLEGVRRVVLDAVRKAEGEGCPPGILGVCIGGDRGTGYTESKRLLLRLLDDVNEDPVLAELEQRILAEANTLGIGPMGLGGKTTLLGVKIGTLHRVPASYFVTISYMCWEHRRRSVRIEPNGTYEIS